MKNFMRRVTAGILLTSLILTAGPLVAHAEETAQVHAEAETKNPLEVSAEELAGGKVFLATADMVDEQGTLTVEGGEWNRIVVPRNIKAVKVLFKGVKTEALVIESGVEYTVEVSDSSVTNVEIVTPRIEAMDYEKLNEMLAAGVDAAEVAKASRDYQAEKKEAEELQPEITFSGASEISLITMTGNAKLDLKDAKAEKIQISGDGTQDKLNIEIIGHNGSLDVAQTETAEYAYNILNLELKDSELTELNVAGDTKAVCHIEGAEDAGVGLMKLEGAVRVTMNVDTAEIRMDEKAEKASVKIYADVENVVVTGDANEVSVAASAKVESAVVEGDNVKVNMSGTIENSTITGEGSAVKHVPVTTPKPKPPAPDSECTHEMSIRYCTLVDGAETCKDGVHAKSYCLLCEKVVLEETIEPISNDVHYLNVVDYFNFCQYGEGYEGCFYIWSCPCGKEEGPRWTLLDRNSWTYSSTSEMAEDGVTHRFYTFVKGNITFEREYFVTYVGSTEKRVTYFRAYEGETLVKELSVEVVVVAECSHYDAYSTVELLEGSKTCEDGLLVTLICKDCGEVKNSWTVNEHWMDVIKEVDLSAYDICEDHYIQHQACACGAVNDCVPDRIGSRSVSKEEDSEGRTHTITRHTCADSCGLEFTEDIVELSREGCTARMKYTYQIYVDDVLVDTIEFEQMEDAHTTVASGVLVEGATSCTDGVMITETCTTCNEVVDSYKSTYHITCMIDSIDTSAVEGSCGGMLGLYDCACGSYGKYVEKQDMEHDFTQEYESYTDSAGNRQNIYKYTCKTCPVSYEEYRINNGKVENSDLGACAKNFTCTYIVYNGEAELGRFIYSYDMMVHDGEIWKTGELMEGSKTCEDGWILDAYCVVCGRAPDRYMARRYDHFTDLNLERVDTSTVEGSCGGVIDLLGCLCGKEADVKIDTDHEFVLSQVTQEAGEEKIQNHWKASCKTCSVSYEYYDVENSDADGTVHTTRTYTVYDGETELGGFSYTLK